MIPVEHPTKWFLPGSTLYSADVIVGNTLGVQQYVPLQCRRAGVVMSMGIYQTFAQTRIYTYQLGIYNSTNGRPSTLVTDFGQVATLNALPAGNKTLITVTGSATLRKGNVYWLAIRLISAVGATIGTRTNVIGDAIMNPPNGMPNPPIVQVGGSSGQTMGLEHQGMGTGVMSADVTAQTDVIVRSSTLPAPYYSFFGADDATSTDMWGWVG